MKLAFILTLILLIRGYCSSSVLNVPGSYDTIQEAIENAVDGDTILKTFCHAVAATRTDLNVIMPVIRGLPRESFQATNNCFNQEETNHNERERSLE